MLLPPGTDAHHYELKPEDIVKVSKTDIFLFTNFEMEQWAYKIINAAEKNTNMLAIETGAGAVLLPLNKDEEKQENHVSKFDPHIWLDMDNAQKMVDNIAEAFIKKDPRNSDYYLKNAHNYKLKLIALDQRYRTELTKCRTKQFYMPVTGLLLIWLKDITYNTLQHITYQRTRNLHRKRCLI